MRWRPGWFRWLPLLTVLLVAACGDGGLLDSPTSTESTQPTTSSANTGPDNLVTPECDGGGLCAAGFELNRVFHALSCAAVQDDLVTSEVLGSGSLYDDVVTVNVIEGVAPTIMVAVSIPGGGCSEVDPAAVHSDWSMAFPEGADQTLVHEAVCAVGALSPSQYLADRCHTDGPLLSCGTGPAFPPEVVEDLSFYPAPADSFGADPESILGNDDPQALMGWHVIVEDLQVDGSYIQLLLRRDPASGELQYILDGSDEDFSSPRPCLGDPELLIRSFIRFAEAPDQETFDSLPFADSVRLGLGPTIVTSVSTDQLLDPEMWVLDVDEFRAHVGPFSALDLLAAMGAYVVTVGDHDHCASPPVPAPDGLQTHTRISVQPRPDPTSSCLSWSTVDFFIDDQGRVIAITMDIWEP